jgi:beta-galactosidase
VPLHVRRIVVFRYRVTVQRQFFEEIKPVVGVDKRFCGIMAAVVLLGATAKSQALAEPFPVVGEESLSLNGIWKFKAIPGATSTSYAPLVSAASDIVVDNENKNQVEVVGPKWTLSRWKEGGALWGESYLVATERAAQTPAWVIFKPIIPQARTYEVFTNWSRGERDTAVKITVNYQGGSKVLSIDQTQGGGRWASLGRFPFAPNAGNNIKIDASGAGAQVVADAVLLRPVKDAGTTNALAPKTVETALFAPTTNDANWEQMAVPGNWDTTNAYAHHVGKAWYRRNVTVPRGWRGSRVRLKFDAVYHDATVYLNGKLLGEHVGGYTPFEFDVTNALNYDRPNLVAVVADNTYRRGAWWAWGGISRPVQLIRNNDVRIVRQHIRTEPELATGTAKVFARIWLQNTAPQERAITLNTRITLRNAPNVTWTNTDAPALATTVRVPAGTERIVEWSTTMPAARVRLWHFDQPNLYNFETSATVGNRVLHRKSDRFGIRKIEVNKDQLLLNGEPIRMPGFNRVHDHRVWGNTEPDHLVKQDVDLMKRMGGNLSRIMHGPQAPNLLDYMDEKGMLVFTEIPVWGGIDPRMKEEGYPTTRRWLQEMIERDYNHPSIIGWSVGNELTSHYDYVRTMLEHVRKNLDPHRLAGYVSYTGARGSMGPHNDPITFSDLIMHNNYGSMSQMAPTLRQRWPEKAIFYTEFGSGQIGLSLDSKVPGLEKKLDDIRQAHPYVVGTSLWTYNDYRSAFQGTPASEDRAWGVVNVWRQPKRAFGQVALQFSPIRSLAIEHVALPAPGQTVQSTVRLEPRGAVDYPSYILRDYKLRWELRRPDGSVAEGGLFNLPPIKPGDAALTRPVTWKMPATAVRDITLSLITPTGYVVHETHEPLSVPQSPQIQTVFAGDKAARVVFTPVAGADQYKVLYKAANQPDWQESKTATIEPQLTVDNLSNGTSYQFAVIALNRKGRSMPSAPMNGTPNGQLLPPIIWKAVPTNGGFTIGYSVENDDQDFSLEYGTHPNRLTRSVSDLALKGAAAVTGLQSGTTYYVRLKRRALGGESTWSPVVSVVPNGGLPPATPRLLGVVRGAGQAVLRFEPSEGATAYRIRYSVAGTTANLFTELNAAAVEQAIISGIEDGRSYTFAIAAVGENGVSAFSSPITLQPVRP